MRSNREFYKALEGLLKRYQNKRDLALEDYLLSLQYRARLRKDEERLPLVTLLALLKSAFSPLPEGIEGLGEVGKSAPGFNEWDTIIGEQIRDLSQMRENGQLKDQQRYFGIDAPSGRRWYNFDPCSYLECAAAGSLGGWEEGDQTGRCYVPGQAAVSSGDGEIITCDPRQLYNPPKEINGISWDQFRDFLWCGQQYE